MSRRAARPARSPAGSDSRVSARHRLDAHPFDGDECTSLRTRLRSGPGASRGHVLESGGPRASRPRTAEVRVVAHRGLSPRSQDGRVTPAHLHAGWKPALRGGKQSRVFAVPTTTLVSIGPKSGVCVIRFTYVARAARFAARVRALACRPKNSWVARREVIEMYRGFRLSASGVALSALFALYGCGERRRRRFLLRQPAAAGRGVERRAEVQEARADAARAAEGGRGRGSVTQSSDVDANKGSPTMWSP